MNAPSLIHAGFPSEGEIFPVSSFRLAVLPGEHPWQAGRDVEIARHWEGASQANPHLFDGQMVFQHQLSFAEGHIEGRAHMVPYSTFLHWRASGRLAGGYHLFAMPMILSSDGALIAIRMAETTANPGRVYSPAGSLDDQDIVDGFCDLAGNMRRETREETGLDLGAMSADEGCFAVHVLNSVAVFRIFRAGMSAEDIVARIETHAASDPHPEIAAAVVIRDADPGAHDYSPFMLPILRWLFNDRNT
jgi:8-oxo-dGTP pyrophosphatase MutT (NUDIX family)